jgi:hypothetical protein
VTTTASVDCAHRVWSAGENLWGGGQSPLTTTRRSTATCAALGQTVDTCGKPQVNEITADLRKHPFVPNPQALSLRPTFYLPDEKVSAR